MEKTILDAIESNIKLIQKLKANGISAIADCAQLIIESVSTGGCVYICGNGGSATDAQHIAGEMVGRFRKERKAFAAVALTSDTAVITSIANDYGYDEIFRRQLEGLAKAGDVLWAFSTSGNSANVVKAAKLANEIGVKVIAFTGKSGSVLESLSDVCICADCDVTSTSQELHLLCYHIICMLVEEKLA